VGLWFAMAIDNSTIGKLQPLVFINVFSLFFVLFVSRDSRCAETAVLRVFVVRGMR
jgi:hypothetical protein